MNKSTNGKGNNSSRDEWETPQWLFEKLNGQYHFNFDCCANEHNKKCEKFTTDFESIKDKVACGWMNPPFSIAHRMFNHFVKVIDSGVTIYRADNFETAIWQNILFPNAEWIFIPNRRINYEGLGGEAARFPSALVGINLPKPEFLDGTTVKKI